MQHTLLNKTPPLPIELWHEIIVHATAIPYEFDISRSPFDNDVQNREKSYRIRWTRTVKDRLHLALVCKYLHKISQEFLYSSFLLQTLAHFHTFIAVVQSSPSIAKRVKRVTIDGYIDPSEQDLLRFSAAIGHCVNLLSFVDFGSRLGCRPTTNPRLLHLDINKVYSSKDPEDHLEELRPLLKSLSTFTSLKSLRISELMRGCVERSIRSSTLPDLEVLEIDIVSSPPAPEQRLLTRWLPKCHFPRLHTLIIGTGHQATLALLQFGSQLTTLGLDGSPSLCRFRRSERIPTPRLRQLVAKHTFFTSKWASLPRIIQLVHVEIVDIQMRHAMVGTLSWENAWKSNNSKSRLIGLLSTLSQQTITPSLKEINFDLGPETCEEIWQVLRGVLLGWYREIRRIRPEIPIRTYYYRDKIGEGVVIPLSRMLKISADLREHLNAMDNNPEQRRQKDPKTQNMADHNDSNRPRSMINPLEMWPNTTPPTTPNRNTRQPFVRISPLKNLPKPGIVSNTKAVSKLHVIHKKLSTRKPVTSPNTSLKASSDDELNLGFEHRLGGHKRARYS